MNKLNQTIKSTLIILILFGMSKHTQAFYTHFDGDLGNNHQSLVQNTTIHTETNAFNKKILFLENELNLTQNLLARKSHSSEEAIQRLTTAYQREIDHLKREIALKNRTIFEQQRTIEKKFVSEELRALIKANNELFSENRSYQDQIAYYQLLLKNNEQNQININRSPASQNEKTTYKSK